MDYFAIYGNPVHHSKSPLMHNYVFKHLGFEACYTRVLLTEGSQLKKDFLDRKLSGANVTVPHKEAAFLACDEVRGFAQTVGVVNTIVNENGRLIGYNTDADGFIYALNAFTSPIKSVLVLGAGGTATALVHKFIEVGMDVTVLNRTASRLVPFNALKCHTATWETFEPKEFDLIVNTTSAGLEDDSLPAPKELLERLIASRPFIADAIYGKVTPFLALMRSHHLDTIDGKSMLVGQGVLANELFTKHTLKAIDIEPLMVKALTL